ncbi:hypothetical protein [Trinickia soli]|jgi:hypothetical protein|uniref:Phage tail protein n=1 Tax=Trinickia soli TaxID=380675 RepID=A0A2N7W9Y4_9BURK|nr:hypothetical protein [Trinickia soli]KAA0085097.1 hypothetical protein CIW54_16770 [Paraburkholderia sp. T12-10]PMS26207.1 hypothetical protein C0Z19_08250 [Trinickia soli]CAB3678461.1 hypothetical protein LMG24076_02292 [Trinickia soli]
MNLEEQIGAIDAQVDRLSELLRLAQAAAGQARAEALPETETEANAAPEPSAGPEAQPTLRVARPSHNELTLSIGAQTVTLRPEQIGQLIEELANARASMKPEPPMALAPGWRFASTKNPVMAMQKQTNGDRLLFARHTGHGWVPFAFSPDAAIQLYMLLTQK